MTKKSDIIVYQAKSGAIELKADYGQETIWVTQSQMAEMFGVNSQAVTKHLKNIYTEKELSKGATCSILEQVQSEGKRQVKRSVQAYNLDAMISVGYRVSSKTGTKFRQWATKTLRSHIVDGYTINPSRIDKNYQAFLQAVENVKKLLPAGSGINTGDTLELVKMFASTWFSIDAYDKSTLPKFGLSKKQVRFTANELEEALVELKKDLIAKKEATEIFAQEKQAEALSAIVGNIFQSVSKKDAYPTHEDKAAHLLYFIIKNHPFTDGNKRSGAFSFVWFLRKTGLLDTSRLSPEALTALTLLIADSDPREKERMIGVVLLLIRKK